MRESVDAGLGQYAPMNPTALSANTPKCAAISTPPYGSLGSLAYVATIKRRSGRKSQAVSYLMGRGLRGQI